ncbi:MAG: hypothetical protein AMXMBFR83_19100 [Phycisphaerae bacterium]
MHRGDDGPLPGTGDVVGLVIEPTAAEGAEGLEGQFVDRLHPSAKRRRRPSEPPTRAALIDVGPADIRAPSDRRPATDIRAATVGERFIRA